MSYIKLFLFLRQNKKQFSCFFFTVNVIKLYQEIKKEDLLTPVRHLSTQGDIFFVISSCSIRLHHFTFNHFKMNSVFQIYCCTIISGMLREIQLRDSIFLLLALLHHQCTDSRVFCLILISPKPSSVAYLIKHCYTLPIDLSLQKWLVLMLFFLQ